MRIFTKQFKAILTSNRDIYDSIAIIIAFDFIHNNFNTKISNLLKIGDKTINKI